MNFLTFLLAVIGGKLILDHQIEANNRVIAQTDLAEKMELASIETKKVLAKGKKIMDRIKRWEDKNKPKYDWQLPLEVLNFRNDWKNRNI